MWLREMERAKLAAGINVGTRCVGFSIGARLHAEVVKPGMWLCVLLHCLLALAAAGQC